MKPWQAGVEHQTGFVADDNYHFIDRRNFGWR